MNGHKVLTKRMINHGSTDNEKINVEHLTPGMYNLLIRSNTETLATKFEKL